MGKYLALTKSFHGVLGTICWSVGWGVTQNTGGDNVLKQVAIDLVSEKRCKEEYRSTITSKSTICGGTTPGQDTCQGDR